MREGVRFWSVDLLFGGKIKKNLLRSSLDSYTEQMYGI